RFHFAKSWSATYRTSKHCCTRWHLAAARREPDLRSRTGGVKGGKAKRAANMLLGVTARLLGVRLLGVRSCLLPVSLRDPKGPGTCACEGARGGQKARP